MTDDTRRSPAAFVYSGPDGEQRGDAEAVIGDAALTVGPVTVEYLDADTFAAADYRLTLGLWPDGSLALSQLGRRFDTFVAQLRRIRSQARVAGLLAHGIAMPEVFDGALLQAGAEPAPAQFQVYDTHVTVVPEAGDPFQLPHGALTAITTTDDPPAVLLGTATGRVAAGRLARRRDAFFRAVSERREGQQALLAELTGQPGFADGLALARSRVPAFDRLVERSTSPDRAPCAAALLGAARGGEPHLGFVQLLDPDAEALQSPAALPEHWASFLLVPVGPLVVLEILAGPGAATYVFEGALEAVNRDLQLLHFRRGALALSGKEAEPAPGNPWRLALRKLEPLRRLRAATCARLIHNEGWDAALAKALA
jgi:hypothetical protein